MLDFTQKVVTGKALKFAVLTLFLTVCLPSSGDSATTVYVSDTNLEANLRSGTTQEHRIIGLLRSGTQLTLIREEGGWAEVTLADGRTGWILARYISERAPWRVTAEKLAAENEQLRAQLTEIGTANRELIRKNNELQGQTNGQQQDLQAVRREYEDLKKSSTNYLNLKMAYEKLQDEARQNKAEHDELEKAYGDLKTSSSIRWFLSGAGVLLLGWILGSSVARIRRRRSADYYKL